MPKSSANYDIKPVSEIPAPEARSRSSKFQQLLTQVRDQPGTPFQVAVYKNAHGAANRRAALRKNDKFGGYTFDARTVDSAQFGVEGERWSVLYATYNG